MVASRPAPVSESDQARWFSEEVLPHEPAFRACLRRRFSTENYVGDIVQHVQLRRQSGGKIESVGPFHFTSAHNAVLRLCGRRQLWQDVPVAELPAKELPEIAAGAPETPRLRNPTPSSAPP